MITVGIAGLGLMGGSLALALSRKRGDKYRVVCVTRDEGSLTAALNDGAIAEGRVSNGDGCYELFKECGAVFLCVPVPMIAATAARIAPYLKSGCVITDVGSVKGCVCASMASLAEQGRLGGAVFVGGHPMAGSEKSGYGAASETLYENACYIITPSKDTSGAGLIAEIARDIGALPLIMDAKRHDGLVAAVSHVPHIAAAALAAAMANLGDGAAREIAAGGFRDTTRIAGGDAALWQGIITENRDEVLKALNSYIGILKDFESDLRDGRDGRIGGFFERAKRVRDSLDD